ncbi:peptide-methionine (S)-S-oxide reductase MsrA [Polymorphobacter fuscus]|uniref:Peptide methionine sulfoxide reductase MsrA n=1 Tax=Sandarakinorhabdus fusca TaxID=1439888 RepID=A0A7C9GVJ9_9SPHN|nr:peptide-methionine (S)-S-oxide reductase MsrA [Polymorphobacter fuscus]KAB7646166.1 peptide-methionine (S)-S-oxide reductase MsrA [Polymorphobacter fuscus]MQT17369.1 peptide-methionine (S)-S-oxide reductase MsrA [Polymorphobacter fuscus]NJC10097.1 peptide-methionine (S)-S-oxide reductase [Polymorphobacter fuscus]
MSNLAVVTLAGGCFWCTEAVFNELRGVESVVSGYIGGSVDHPTYEQVCSGRTGHAEAVRIAYDPDVVGLDDLLDIFFHTHDPTTLNRQGADTGTQYRSAIFPADAAQRDAAEAAIRRNQAVWDAPIVTTIEPDSTWYPAEDYHQRYFERNGTANGYCAAVVAPKLAKFRKGYAARLKRTAASV